MVYYETDFFLPFLTYRKISKHWDGFIWSVQSVDSHQAAPEEPMSLMLVEALRVLNCFHIVATTNLWGVTHKNVLIIFYKLTCSH